MGTGERYFLGHSLGQQRFIYSDVFSVDDVGPDDDGLYTIRTWLRPALAFGWSGDQRLDGVNYNYLSRRRQSAMQEESEYGLSVAVLAIGAEFVYDAKRLADARRR